MNVEHTLRLLWFCVSALCDWLPKLASATLSSKGSQNQNQLLLARAQFPALGNELLRILIGSLRCIRPLWLGRVFTLIAFTTGHVPPEVPQILINREPLRHMTFDVELLGDCDVIISELCQRLGGDWNSLLDGSEIPGLERQPLSTEERMTIGEECQEVKSEDLRQDSDQVFLDNSNNPLIINTNNTVQS